MTPGKVAFEGARTDWALKCTVITPQFVSSIHRLRLCGLKAWGLRKTPELWTVWERNILVLCSDISKHDTMFARLLICALHRASVLMEWTDGQGCTILSPLNILGSFWVSSNQYLLFLSRWLQSCSKAWGGAGGAMRCLGQSHIPASLTRACYQWTPVAHSQVSYPAPCWGGGATLGQPSWLLERQEEALLLCLCLFRERAASLSLSTEPTISIANQELSEILKLNLKPQDMYKRVRIMPAFLSVTAAPLCLFRVEMGLWNARPK